MVLKSSIPAYEEFLEYLIEKARPEDILAFRVSDKEQRRAEELLERNSEGSLTHEESEELQQMLQFERFMAVLKAKALKSA
jgi:exonuclease V gamma subunit